MMVNSTFLKLKSSIVDNEEENDDATENHDPLKNLISCLMNKNEWYYERLHSSWREDKRERSSYLYVIFLITLSETLAFTYIKNNKLHKS